MRQHLRWHQRLIVGFALFRRIHHLRIPGLGLLKLLFRRRIAKIALQQCLEQLRQTLGIAICIQHQTIVGIGGEADPANGCLVAKLIERDTREIVIQREHHLIFGTIHRFRITQHHADIHLWLAREITAWGIHHAQRRLIDNELGVRIILSGFDKRKIIRNVRVQFRQRQRNLSSLLLPGSEGLVADLVYLIRCIDKVGRFVMRFVRADVPDTGILRGHHRQARF